MFFEVRRTPCVRACQATVSTCLWTMASMITEASSVSLRTSESVSSCSSRSTEMEISCRRRKQAKPGRGNVITVLQYSSMYRRNVLRSPEVMYSNFYTLFLHSLPTVFSWVRSPSSDVTAPASTRAGYSSGAAATTDRLLIASSSSTWA